MWFLYTMIMHIHTVFRLPGSSSDGKRASNFFGKPRNGILRREKKMNRFIAFGILGLLALLSACGDGSRADGGDRDLAEVERTEDVDGDGDLPDGEWPDADEADRPEEDDDPDAEASEIDEIENDTDQEKDIDSDRDGEETESGDSENDGPEIEPDIEQSLETLFPETSACPPFPRKLGRWVGDFPRVPTGRQTAQVHHSQDGLTILSGSGHFTLYPAHGKPTTFFTSKSTRYPMRIEIRPGVWYSAIRFSYGYDLWRLDESAEEWGWNKEKHFEELNAEAFFMDSRGIFWFSHTHGGQYHPLLVRWDGENLWNIGLMNIPGFDRVSLVPEAFECRGRIFFFGSIRYPDPSTIGVIFELTSDERSLDVWWKSDRGINDSFDSASVNPETCDFVAAGYRLLVEGNLKEPYKTRVLSTSSQILPNMIWKDWESDTLYGTPAFGTNAGRTFFARMRSGETRFESMPDDGIIDMLLRQTEDKLGYYYSWGPRHFSGRTLDDLFVAAADVPYRYNPRKDGFEIAYRHPLLKKPNIMENAIVRSIVVGERDGRFRVHATGYGLPVMRRTACLEWEEAFPDSEWAMALDDTGEHIWVVGEHPNLMRGAGDDWREIPGGGWERAREVIELPDGRLYVLGEVGIPNVTAKRFLYLHTGDNWTDSSGWRLLDFTEPEYREWIPRRIIRNPRGDILMLVERKLYSRYTLTRDVFRITGDRMEFLASFPYQSTLSNHDGEVTVNTTDGVFLLDTEDGATVQVVPNTEVRPYGFHDSLRLSDGRWQFLSCNGLAVYDPSTGEFEEILSLSEDLNAVGPEWYFPEIDEFRLGMVVLQALPTGEILAGGVEGRILLKLLDE